MIKKLDLKDIYTVRQVIKLQVDSYRIEADLIGFKEIPPLMDTVISLGECNENFFGYYLGDNLAGIISYKIYDDVLDIHRVAVHPQYFRKGIAGKLIRFVEEKNQRISKIVVYTGKKNQPAVNLYLKYGFLKGKDIEISKDIYMTEFEKVL